MTRYWEPGVSYNAGEVLEHQGQSYKVIQGHPSQVSALSVRNSTFILLSSGMIVMINRATGPRVLGPLRCLNTWVRVSIMNPPNSTMNPTMCMNTHKVCI
jgi:hypothetical protein